MSDIPGYTLGTDVVPASPVTPADFAAMRDTALFGDEDVRFLKMSAVVLEDQIEDVLDVWYGFIGSQPHLVADFVDTRTGKPSADYLGAVRRRFGQWIRDTANAQYDAQWIAYQLEIGRRHHRVGKNLTDGVPSTPLVPFRHLLPILFPVLATLRPFLAKKGHDADDVDGMASAWQKSVLLQLALWSRAYIKDGDW